MQLWLYISMAMISPLLGRDVFVRFGRDVFASPFKPCLAPAYRVRERARLPEECARRHQAAFPACSSSLGRIYIREDQPNSSIQQRRVYRHYDKNETLRILSCHGRLSLGRDRFRRRPR